MIVELTNHNIETSATYDVERIDESKYGSYAEFRFVGESYFTNRRKKRMNDFRVIATEGYNDGYYWDYRIWFEYGNNSYTYINYGSFSGYIPCHEAITKNVMDLLEGDRDPKFSASVSIDKEKLINYAERLNASGEYELSFDE